MLSTVALERIADRAAYMARQTKQKDWQKAWVDLENAAITLVEMKTRGEKERRQQESKS